VGYDFLTARRLVRGVPEEVEHPTYSDPRVALSRNPVSFEAEITAAMIGNPELRARVFAASSQSRCSRAAASRRGCRKKIRRCGDLQR
jgi:hypothetical protein